MESQLLIEAYIKYYLNMPSFTQITLDKTHHRQGVKCAKCEKILKPGQKAWKHTRKYGSRYFCPKCYKALWH
ncbi:MAG: hypothetical protein QXK93_08575 [Candidatus Bathyarchaeia archaeon]